MAKNRYIGEYPVIGIRPIIDGRRGPMQLRESLEDQVMAMAEAAKKLFEENLYYSNGEHVIPVCRRNHCVLHRGQQGAQRHHNRRRADCGAGMGGRGENKAL